MRQHAHSIPRATEYTGHILQYYYPPLACAPPRPSYTIASAHNDGRRHMGHRSIHLQLSAERPTIISRAQAARRVPAILRMASRIVQKQRQTLLPLAVAQPDIGLEDLTQIFPENTG